MFVLEKIAQYAKDENRKAVIYHDKVMTYAELEQFSNAFADFLLKNGKDKSPVVIYGHKEEEFLPCMYGALKAGRAYVPVDITFPADRLEMVLSDVSPEFFVTLRDTDVAVCEGTKRLDVNEIDEIFKSYKGGAIDSANWVKPEDNCYILFTSGSTGRPKGVPINRANIENLASQLIPWCDIEANTDIITNQISFSFDVSVVSVYMGVSLGKTLYTIDKTMMETPASLYEGLENSNLSFWVSTPSFAELCAMSEHFNEKMLPNLKRFLFCGETLTHKLVDLLNERFPNADVINTYGPTEATVLVTASLITREMAEDQKPIPIGEPLPEVEFRIVDSEGKPVKEGETGELQIISDNVGHGYYGRPDLTQKAFFETESRGVKKRGYRTGDACYQCGKLYYFCGRMDFQIKLNGYRIELEDIENNMVKVENVSRAVVIPVMKEEKVDYLAAFVLSTKEIDGPKLREITRIKSELAKLVPNYMVPRKIVLCSSLPTNTNGKVDRKELAKQL